MCALGTIEETKNLLQFRSNQKCIILDKRYRRQKLCGQWLITLDVIGKSDVRRYHDQYNCCTCAHKFKYPEFKTR